MIKSDLVALLIVGALAVPIMRAELAGNADDTEYQWAGRAEAVDGQTILLNGLTFRLPTRDARALDGARVRCRYVSGGGPTGQYVGLCEPLP